MQMYEFVIPAASFFLLHHEISSYLFQGCFSLNLMYHISCVCVCLCVDCRCWASLRGAWATCSPGRSTGASSRRKEESRLYACSYGWMESWARHCCQCLDRHKVTPRYCLPSHILICRRHCSFIYAEKRAQWLKTDVKELLVSDVALVSRFHSSHPELPSKPPFIRLSYHLAWAFENAELSNHIRFSSPKLDFSWISNTQNVRGKKQAAWSLMLWSPPFDNPVNSG